jgi:hypothetical protein
LAYPLRFARRFGAAEDVVGMKISKRAAAIAVALSAALGGCGGEYDAAAHKNTHESTQDASSGFLTGGSGGLLNFGTSHNKTQTDTDPNLGVNAYLWRGTLETLKFMPLASADPFGGVIITDWWTPASSTGERFKATAYVLGRQLRADAIRVSLFRQVQENGQWVDAPVDPSKPTELENMVLAKARELRSQSASATGS